MAQKLLLGFAFLLSACAQQKVTLNSSSMVPFKRLESTINTTKLKGELNVLSFTDQRKKAGAVGVAKTGLGNIETPIFLDMAPEEYVKTRFVSGLSKRGISVGNSKYGLRGNIKKLWVWEQIEGLRPEASNCEMEIEFDIVAVKENDVRFHGVVSSSAMGSDGIIDTTHSNGAVLEFCMNYVLEKFVQDPKLQSFLGFEVVK